MRGLQRFLPILGWLPRYDRSWLSADVIAGLTVLALVVPESMAYAGIAGVPVQYGLYAVPLALLGYLIFGTSRQLLVGPSATVASISATVVGTTLAAGAVAGSTPDPDAMIVLTGALSLIVGVLYIVGGIARLGFVARFFAKPVLDGFIVGLGLYIAVGQIHKLVGIPSPDGDTVAILVQDMTAIGSWHWWTTILGVASLAALFGLARVAPRLPGALLVVVAGILATKVLGLTDHGVAVVGAVPTGFAFAPWDSVTIDQIAALIPGAVAVVIVGFAQSVAIAKAYATKYQYRIDPSQEMIGYGAANIGAGLLQGITVTGSLSKSGAAEEAGGRSPVLLAVVSALTVVTIVLLAFVFADLPETVLAAVVIHAVSGMMRPTQLVALRRRHLPEFWLAAGALLGVIVFGILAGIAIGVALSFILLIRQLDHPHVGILARSPDGSLYRDSATHPDFQVVPGALIHRFEAPLIFANAEIFIDDVDARLKAAQPRPTTLILDLEAVSELDSTGAEALRVLQRSLSASDTQLRLARGTATVMASVRANDLIEAVGEANVHPSVADAVAAHETSTRPA